MSDTRKMKKWKLNAEISNLDYILRQIKNTDF